MHLVNKLAITSRCDDTCVIMPYSYLFIYAFKKSPIIIVFNCRYKNVLACSCYVYYMVYTIAVD